MRRIGAKNRVSKGLMGVGVFFSRGVICGVFFVRITFALLCYLKYGLWADLGMDDRIYRINETDSILRPKNSRIGT